MEVVAAIPKRSDRQSKWVAFADGLIRRFDRGTDFRCPASTYAGSVNMQLKRLGLQGSAVVRGKSVFVRISPRGPK